MGLRKAYEAIKDSTAVKLVKVNSVYKDLDVPIVKATSHVEAPPKESYIRKVFAATSVIRPQSDAAYCIQALARRLAKTSNWIVAIKVLIVIHRTLREGDPFFRELLTNHSYRGRVLHLANFKDDSGHHAWNCFVWVCTYALYLEERLQCFRVLKYDIETERLTRSFHNATKVYSKTRALSAEELLQQLPALQNLLYRLVGCEPRGLACTNYAIQYALTLVLKDSFKIYCSINDGIINLVNMYFDMPKHDAVKALGIYKRAGVQAEALADFYDYCKHLALARNFQFPTLRQPPSTFLATMEEYVKEAPQTGSVSKRQPAFDDHCVCKAQESKEKDESSHKKETPEEAEGQAEHEEEIKAKNEQEEPDLLIECESPLLISTDDLLGLNDFPEVEESNVPTAATNGWWF